MQMVENKRDSPVARYLHWISAPGTQRRRLAEVFGADQLILGDSSSREKSRREIAENLVSEPLENQPPMRAKKKERNDGLAKRGPGWLCSR